MRTGEPQIKWVSISRQCVLEEIRDPILPSDNNHGDYDRVVKYLEWIKEEQPLDPVPYVPIGGRVIHYDGGIETW